MIYIVAALSLVAIAVELRLVFIRRRQRELRHRMQMAEQRLSRLERWGRRGE